MELLEKIAAEVEKGEEEETAKLTGEAIAGKLGPKEILDGGLVAGMRVVGVKFKAHEIFLPDVLLAAKAMYAGLDLVQPLLEGEGGANQGTVVIGSVKGDLHDIGKNLVGIMLRGAGYGVIDLGADVSPEKLVDTAKEKGAKVIGLSALLTTTMTMMKQVADLLVERGMRDEVKLIIGGAPVTAEYATEIGADGYGFDAMKAVDLVNELI